MKVIAHRGASGEYPENSLLAFEQAMIQGADAIELDVHYHAPSNCFVVIHDHFVDKTTQERGHINSFSLSLLTTLTIGSGQCIPTLAQVLHAINGRVLVNIEVKTVAQNEAELNTLLISLQAHLSEAERHFNFTATQIVISSFDHYLLTACQQLMPHYAVSALIAHNPIDSGKSLIDLNVYGVNPAIDCLSINLVNQLTQAGLKVWVYTVDRHEDIMRCLTLNVDGIFTNFPKQSQNAIKKYTTNEKI